MNGARSSAVGRWAVGQAELTTRRPAECILCAHVPRSISAFAHRRLGRTLGHLRFTHCSGRGIDHDHEQSSQPGRRSRRPLVVAVPVPEASVCAPAERIHARLSTRGRCRLLLNCTELIAVSGAHTIVTKSHFESLAHARTDSGPNASQSMSPARPATGFRTSCLLLSAIRCLPSAASHAPTRRLAAGTTSDDPKRCGSKPLTRNNTASMAGLLD